MSEKVQAGYQLLNESNKKFMEAFKVLAEGLELQKRAFEMLQVNNLLQVFPTAAPTLPTMNSPITQQPKMGCEVEVAFWQKERGFSGKVIIKENGQEAKYRFVLFESNPNDKGMTHNGGIVPMQQTQQGVSFRDAQVGGIFVYAKNNGFVVSGFLDEGQLNNKINFSGKIEGVQRMNDDYPHLKAICQTGDRFFNDAAVTMMGNKPQPVNTSNVATNPVQQIASDNLLTGLVSPPGAPADPIVKPHNPLEMIQPMPQPLASPDAMAAMQQMTQNPQSVNTDVLTDPLVDELKKLLG